MARLPLEDIKIVDFGWVLAGPHGTRMLADLGAQVIKIESKAKMDGWRQMPAVFQEQGRNKMGLSINVKSAKGRGILERLVKTADVVTCNYDPNGFRKLGLEWEKLKELNPGIIVVNASGVANWGPYSSFMTFAPNLQALSGMISVIGYPDHEPLGFAAPFADYMGGATLAISVLSALEYRRKTGKGQFIDIGQCEAVSAFLGIHLLDWAANNKMRSVCGNYHPAAAAAPHNCYQCKGEDRWCVIAVASEKEWKSFCKVMGNPEWTRDPRFTTHLNRITNQKEMDKLIGAWTIGYSAEEIVEKMQRGGVSAGVVQNIEDILKHDAHLRERGFLMDLESPDVEPPTRTYPGVMTRIPGKTVKTHHPAPAFGQDNSYILKDMLGMTQDEIDEAAAEGAFA
jgi:benzylsuccinate CoA-transferase BbsF subunit